MTSYVRFDKTLAKTSIQTSQMLPWKSCQARAFFSEVVNLEGLRLSVGLSFWKRKAVFNLVCGSAL